MNKQAIITILFALVAIAGYGQSFTPIVEDSIDFVITGTTTSTNDSVSAFPCAPYEPGMKFPIRDGKFTVTGRMPRNSFVQIGDNAGNDLNFIVDNVPTDINLVTGEVKGSDLQQRFIRCQMREREIYKVAITWDKSFNKEEKARIREAEKKKKEAAAASIIEQRELVKKLCDCRDDITIEDVIRISKLSSDMGKRAVLQLDDEGGIVKIYESISEASKAIGIAPKTIRDVANGKYKHGGGFCWKYADQLTDE